MAIGCGPKCAKAMLIFFNIIFWLSGCAVLGIGVWLRVDPKVVDILNVVQVNVDSSDSMLEYAAYLLIAVGGFVFIVGFFGCCGALKENKCCLGFYMFLLIIVMGGELAAGILILIYKDPIIEEVNKTLVKEVKQDNYITQYKDNTLEYTAFGVAMNAAQVQFQCCGIVNGTADYIGSNYTVMASELKNGTNGFKDFPYQCCTMKEGTDLTAPAKFENVKDSGMCLSQTAGYINNKGCESQLEDFITKHALIIVGIGIGIGCLEIFGFIFAICLCRNTGSED